MNTNPYKPPASSLETPGGGSKISVWWKVFFWLSLIISVPSALGVASIKGLTLLDYADFALSLVAIVGLYGFSYGKRIGNVVFWRYFFYAVLVETMIISVVFPILGLPRYGSAAVTPLYIIEIAIALLILSALYRYAYRSAFVWESP